jgi:hypothetical protein
VTALRKGFLEEGENDLKNLSVISIMKSLNLENEKPSGVILSLCASVVVMELRHRAAAVENGKGGPLEWDTW